MNRFEDLFTSNEDICHEFQIDEKELKDAYVHAAVYRYEDYSGSALVLFEKNGKLFSVHGSHCSCNGLEDQWEPGEISWKLVLHWLDEGSMFGEFSSELQTHLRDEAVKRILSEN